MSWLKRFLSNQPLREHVPVRGNQEVIGTQVQDRQTGRIVYREMDEVGDIKPGKMVRLSRKKRARLARRFNEHHFDIQSDTYNSKEAFDHLSLPRETVGLITERLCRNTVSAQLLSCNSVCCITLACNFKAALTSAVFNVSELGETTQSSH